MKDIPPAARCSQCHSYQPQIRLECQSDDDYTQLYRFWCNWTCHSNWGTNQPKPKLKPKVPVT